MKKSSVKYLLWFFALLVLIFIVPNVFNSKEKDAFSEEQRLEEAKRITATLKGDSVTVTPGRYYGRSNTYQSIFGAKNRDIWMTPVTAKVLDYGKVHGGLVPIAEGGSQQTISLKLKDTSGRVWTLRSVDKDQQNALPAYLRHSFLRSLFRDQAAGLNPFGALVVSSLAASIKLMATTPELYWVKYDERYGNYNKRMAGRLAYLEENLNESWNGSAAFAAPIAILDTDSLLAIMDRQNVEVDTGLYLKTRLFDMLISDWDRHEGQWKWLQYNEKGKPVYKPLGRDRDMAFYIFDDGILNKLSLVFNPKFQSFREEYASVRGLMWQSEELDEQFLANQPLSRFIDSARALQQVLTPAVIGKAFAKYPAPVFEKRGEKHVQILNARLQRLQGVAAKFHKLVND